MSALCLLLSVGSAAACLLLGAQASALQGRVAALEEERELLRRTGVPGALSAWAEPHLERLLREVRSMRGASRKGVHGTGGGGSVRALGAPGRVAVSPRRVCPLVLCTRVHPGGLREELRLAKRSAGPEGSCCCPSSSRKVAIQC